MRKTFIITSKYHLTHCFLSMKGCEWFWWTLVLDSTDMLLDGMNPLKPHSMISKNVTYPSFCGNFSFKCSISIIKIFLKNAFQNCHSFPPEANELTHYNLMTWHHWSWSELIKEMAWCCHYLNQYWPIINGILWSEVSFTGTAQDINHWNVFENYTF